MHIQMQLMPLDWRWKFQVERSCSDVLRIYLECRRSLRGNCSTWLSKILGSPEFLFNLAGFFCKFLFFVMIPKGPKLSTFGMVPQGPANFPFWQIQEGFASYHILHEFCWWCNFPILPLFRGPWNFSDLTWFLAALQLSWFLRHEWPCLRIFFCNSLRPHFAEVLGYYD